MPIEIAAGGTFTFDVVVNVQAPGETEMDFNLFVDSDNALFIERIHYPLTVVDSGRTQPEWIATAEEKESKTKTAAESDHEPSAVADEQIVDPAESETKSNS